MRADAGLPPRYTPREIAARERRRRRGRVDVTMSRNRVIMALCGLSDPSGTVIQASLKRIAATARVSVTTVRNRLDEMAQRGEVIGFQRRSLAEPPIWVLADGPDAGEAFKLLLEIGHELDAPSRIAQAMSLAGTISELPSKQI